MEQVEQNRRNSEKNYKGHVRWKKQHEKRTVLETSITLSSVGKQWEGKMNRQERNKLDMALNTRPKEFDG